MNLSPSKIKYLGIGVGAAVLVVIALVVRCRSAKVLFPNSDFELGTLQNWAPKGNAFNGQPVQGDKVAPRKRGNSNHAGKFWIGTYEIGGDAPRGVLTSQEFTIEGDVISFLIGAGTNNDQTGAELWVNGKRERSTSSNAAAVKDGESMYRKSWDVKNLRGQRATIVIRDESSGGWGHINVDDFRYGK